MGSKKPLEIKLQLTEKCNYSCSFCFNRQEITATGKNLSKKEAEKTIAKTAEEGIERIRFTGGEPLLHPQLLVLLSLANKKGLYTTLNTNASLISKGKAKKIGKKADNILVSMHSLQQNPKATDAIKQLSKENCFLRAATILTKKNIESLEKFQELVSGMPFKQWVLLRQIPNAFDKNPVSSKDMQTAVEKIERFNEGKKKKDWFLIENALPFCCANPEKVSRIALGGVHEDGHSSLFVDAKGVIKPSYFFDLALGKAGKNSFLDAWKSDFMQRMNSLEFIAETCHNCKHALKCMSGSRFSALLVNKSLYALDPLANPFEFLPLLERNK